MIHYIIEGLMCLVILWILFNDGRKARTLRARLKHSQSEAMQLHDDLRYWQSETHRYKRLLASESDLGTAVRTARGVDAPPVGKRAFA